MKVVDYWRRSDDHKQTLWSTKKFTDVGLDLDYLMFLEKHDADELFLLLEKSVIYYSEEVSKVRIFGKWHSIPRQQVAYGDPGICYTFSGNTLNSLPWHPSILQIRDRLAEITGIKFNIALVNRYRNGNDHIGEHRDNEKELDPDSPIASLSLGAARLFKLRHKDHRRKATECDIQPVNITLEHGSLLLMNPPTNENWYHSLPPRKSVKEPRINITFRKMRA